MENEQYLTYEEYVSLGGTLDIVPFNLLEHDARLNINRETLNRLKGKENIPEEVKLCVYKLVQGMGLDANYLDANTEERKKYIINIIYNSLFGVVVEGETLLYRGI